MGGKFALPNENSFFPRIKKDQKQYGDEYINFGKVTITGLLIVHQSHGQQIEDIN
jgi:hypothetical protein